MAAVNAERQLVRQLPTAALVERWVEHAKTLDAVLTY